MKTYNKAVLAIAALGASTWIVAAQPNEAPAGGGPGGAPPANDLTGATAPRPDGQGVNRGPMGRRLPPVFVALDTNHDGVIDANEIANASTALKGLLKNGATNLTLLDVMGPPPPRNMAMGGMGGRPRGPGGPGGPGGFGGPGPGGFGGPGGRAHGGPGEDGFGAPPPRGPGGPEGFGGGPGGPGGQGGPEGGLPPGPPPGQ